MISRTIGTLGKGALVVGVGLLLAPQCLYTVEPGHRAVIFNRFSGVEKDVQIEGTHFRIPIIQQPIMMDVRTQPRVINTATASKDLQDIQLSLRVLARPKVAVLPSIYRSLGEDFLDRVLPSVVNETLKQVVALYNAEQLLTMRERVSHHLREELTKRCENFDIVVDDVSITHLEFSKDFSHAIEDKQVAEQMAERAKFVVEKAEQEKQAAIIRAEGDAEAAQLVSSALRQHGTGLIEIRRLEAAQTIADTLSQAPNVTYLPSSGSGSGNILFNVQSTYSATPNRPSTSTSPSGNSSPHGSSSPGY